MADGLLNQEEVTQPIVPLAPSLLTTELTEPSQEPPVFVTPEATVANQLDTLLQAGSPLQTVAESRSKEEANRLGLLSSSMAVGAGQKALIESALPIAQQDASTFARSNLARQQAFEQQDLTRLQGGISSELQREGAAQAQELSKQEALQRAGLSEQESAQRIALENIAQNAQTARLATELQAKLDIANTQVAGTNKDIFAETTGNVFQQFQSEFTTIQTTPDDILDAGEKNKLIDQLETQVQNQVDVLASLYSIPIEWV